MEKLFYETQSKTRKDGIVAFKTSGVEYTYPIHTHNYYEFFLVTNGNALHQANGNILLLEKGSLLLVRPSDVHRYLAYRESMFEFYNVCIPPDMITEFCRYALLPEETLKSPFLPISTVLSSGECLFFTELLDKLVSLENPETHNLLLRVLFCHVVYALQYPSAKEKKAIPPWFQSLISEMSKPQNYILGLPRLLELAHYSQEHLTRMFRRYLGMTPTAYINKLRLEHACTLLSGTDHGILTICEQSGFKNASYFYERFKAEFGMPPEQYRRRFLRNTNI